MKSHSSNGSTETPRRVPSVDEKSSYRAPRPSAATTGPIPAESTPRDSGLASVGAVAWGSHFCQFYETRADLLEILVPYFRAGLEANEFCMWITSEPVLAEEARAALAAVVPDLDTRLRAGQIEILDYRQWYVLDGKFDSDRVLNGWIDKLEAARRRGFEGLRLSGNTFWLEEQHWKDFSDYEAAVDRVLGRYRMLALCTYPLGRCGAFEVMDVVRNHQFALIRKGNTWEMIRSMQRQAAESALRASEQRYRTLFRTMREGFALHEILCDERGRPYDYRFLEVNPAFEQQTGLRTDDLIGRTVREVLPALEPMWIERFGRVALTGQAEQFEAWTESLGRWYDVRAYRTEPGRFAVVFTDITGRKRSEEALRQAHERLQLQAEEMEAANEELNVQTEELQASNEELREHELALRESEQRLRRSQEIAHLGSWELDLDHNRLTWSDEVYRIFGLPPREFGATYEAFLEVVHPDDRAAVDAAYARSLRENRDAYEIEHRVVRPVTGEVRFVHEKCTHVRDASGRVIRSLGMVHDITERKQMEEQLRRWNDQLEGEVQARTEELRHTIDRLHEEVARRVQAEGQLRRRSQMLEAFFQHTITPLAFLDRHFNFVRVNEAYAQADHREPEYFPGKNHFVLYPHEENRAIFERVVRTKQPYFARARPFTYPGAPERVTYWDWQLTPLLDEQGEVQFLVLNLEDVTEQQMAFQELKQRARQLQKLTLELSQAEDRERKRLAEVLHDDLQQQLAAAKFHLSILGHRLPKSQVIHEMLSQLEQILKDAIETSRSLSHELSPAVLYQGNLGETFEWLARQLKAKHGLTVHVETRDRIEGAPEALKVLLYKTAREILFNVVKHAGVREARLRLQRVRGCVWLTISDQGRGFDARRPGKTGGFGLLGIRERIELLGGRMKIRSAPGRGSTFLVVVPNGGLRDEAAGTRGETIGEREMVARLVTSDVGRPAKRASQPQPPDDPIAPPHDPLAPSPLRVLLVDDHKIMREGLATLLNEQSDLEVVGQAGNGQEAIHLARELRPDVVVMDVAMPVMAGDEATRQIKRQRPDTRIVALSMFEEAGMTEAMRRVGAEAYLLKTAPFAELLAAIRGRP